MPEFSFVTHFFFVMCIQVGVVRLTILRFLPAPDSNINTAIVMEFPPSMPVFEPIHELVEASSLSTKISKKEVVYKEVESKFRNLVEILKVHGVTKRIVAFFF